MPRASAMVMAMAAAMAVVVALARVTMAMAAMAMVVAVAQSYGPEPFGGASPGSVFFFYSKVIHDFEVKLT